MPLTEIKVRVTKRNIKDATGGECPIVLSLLERGYLSQVTRKCAVVYRQKDGEIVNVFRLPEEAQDFVRNFDEGNPVQPIEFTLERNMDEEA